MFLSHLPASFMSEKSLHGFFSQFGTLKNLRIARNKHTGAGRHYAYLQFDTDEIAKIVAGAMNNYMLEGHLLHCEILPAERVHPMLFRGAQRDFKRINWAQIERTRHDKPRSEEEIAQVLILPLTLSDHHLCLIHFASPSSPSLRLRRGY